MEKKIKFVDAENNIINCEIELKDKEKDKPVFSMSGSYDSSCGQIFDNIKPRTKDQKHLIDLWRKYHLNDVNAGTIEQENILKKCKSKDYEKQIDFLKKHHLYTVTLPDGTKYQYGTAWLYRPLPENFENDLNLLLETIEKENQEYKQDKIENSEIKSFDDFSDPKIRALAKHLEITPQETEDILNENDNIYTYQGIDYFIGDENETEERALSYLTDDPYLWQESVKAGTTTSSLDEWAKEVVNSDGYGHILNSWDGTENQEEIDGVWYYIIRS